jgi:hypothetical protein
MYLGERFQAICKFPKRFRKFEPGIDRGLIDFAPEGEERDIRGPKKKVVG